MSPDRDQDLRSAMPAALTLDARMRSGRLGPGSTAAAEHATAGAVGRATADFFESFRRVARKTRLPTREGVAAFFGNQLLVNAVAWTSGVAAVGLVQSFFEVRSIRNLWGLTASSGRSLVSADDYHLIVMLASYSAGLVMLVLMRHLVLRLIAEFHSLRLERARGVRPFDAAPAAVRAPSKAAADGAAVPREARTRGSVVVDALELLADDLMDD